MVVLWYAVVMIEVWRLIAAHPDYEVSNLGRVRRATDAIVSMPNGGTAIRARAGQLLKIGNFIPNRHGSLPYLRVSLQVRGIAKSLRVHRLVAEAFIPNPDNKPVVNHINCDVSDARAENLEWCTHKENCCHAILNGRQATPNPKFGVNHRSAKLNDDAVKRLRKMSAGGMSNAEVAKVFGINRSEVSRVRNRLSWKHVT
jgi:hypothetical protein